MKEVQYPSISVCVEYAFKKYLEEEIFNPSLPSLNETEKLARENVRKKNETFFFVNHPSVKSNGYPCFTTKESTDPGKPCSFPFMYEKTLNYACSSLDNKQPWCYTKVDANRTTINKEWGICSSDCQGDDFGPSSNHNLAREDILDVWDSDIYDLRTWNHGFCHTYNPPSTLSPSFDFRLGLFLGFNETSFKSFNETNFKSFSLYVHEKEQFWPTQKMDQVERVKILPNTRMEISFKLTSATKLMDNHNQCIDEENYSFTKCLHHFIAEKIGCHLNWFKNSAFQKCSSKSEIIMIQNIFEWIKTSSFSNLTSVTGCFFKCKSSKYVLTQLTDEKIFWQKKWISEVYIQANSASREEMTEYYSYDLGDMIGDLGGYLGLFLGWSLLSMITYLPEFSRKFSNGFESLKNSLIYLLRVICMYKLEESNDDKESEELKQAIKKFDVLLHK